MNHNLEKDPESVEKQILKESELLSPIIPNPVSTPLNKPNPQAYGDYLVRDYRYGWEREVDINKY